MNKPNEFDFSDFRDRIAPILKREIAKLYRENEKVAPLDRDQIAKTIAIVAYELLLSYLVDDDTIDTVAEGRLSEKPSALPLPDKEKIRVLIADDHPTFREGLVTILKSSLEIEIVGQATNGRQAIVLAERYRPDVVILDLRMPEKNGIEATAEIKQRVPEAKVVIFSHFDEPINIYEAIEAGAKSYIRKDTNPEELLKTLKAAFYGEQRLPPDTVNRLPKFNSLKDTTDKEKDVLRLMVQGFKNKEIAERLYIGERMVKIYVTRIIRKLGAKNRTEAVSIMLKG